MLIFARRNLVPRDLPGNRLCVLLEGSWAEETTLRQSLDEQIDAPRFEYLDEQAEQLAERIVASAVTGEADAPNFADLNVLRLRYAALKWLRPIVYFGDLQAKWVMSHVDLFVAAERDAEYIALFQALARRHGLTVRVHEQPGTTAAKPSSSAPSNPWWREALGRFGTWPAVAGKPTARTLFVGNPRLLDGVCDELLSRGGAAAWLYDRFAVRAWVQRLGSGVAWLTCDETSPTANRFPPQLLRNPIVHADVDLSDVVEAWYRTWRFALGSTQTRQWRRVSEHFAAQDFRRVVVDEDQTPLNRIVVRMAALQGVPSHVVQHGVCGVRFGYAPLAADRICAWDDGSRRQLETWRVAADRIVVTGSPYQEAFVHESLESRRRLRANREHAPRRKQIALIAVTPPRDERPDAISFHLTSRTHVEMLRAVCAAVAELADAELVVKLHPRAVGCDSLSAQALGDFPQLRHRVVTRESLSQTLADADCVISCASTGGLDAAAGGIPVVQVLPRGSGNVNPAEWYGLLGTARSLEELRPLLARALAAGVTEVTPPPFVAARRIVDSFDEAPPPASPPDDDEKSEPSRQRPR
jgi:hypothetical protein